VSSTARTLKALLARRQELLTEIDALEKEATDRFPRSVPRCHWCKSAFDRGWHAQCCGCA
jgi:hypothetical protein